MRSQQLSGRKIIVFRVLTIILPIILLILLELGLRLFHCGHDTNLFIRYPDNPNYWVINKYASERYFSDTSNATLGNIEPFEVEKPANTFRIFVLGESTTAGYPYLHNGSFHRWLLYRLMHTYPDRHFEIVNVSLTAVNSYTVLDFGKQVVKYQPDAVLIYTGHNEYYGALGIGSTSHIANNRFLVQTVLELRKFYLVQLIDNLIYQLKKHIAGNVIDKRENLMKRMAANQQIAYHSPEYNAGIEQFKNNMTELCEVLHKEKIPAFLSTLVSNEKDVSPLSSQPKGTAVQTADQQFDLANTSYKSGAYELAKQEYVKAKELDLLRFRAPEAINQIIVELTKKYDNVHLVNTRQLFEQYSPHGIIGNETLLEHVHPNLYGYALISEAFYQSIQHAQLIKAPMDHEISFTDLVSRMPVTRVDSLYGVYTIMMLEAGWPFNKPIPTNFKRGNSTEEQLAGALSVNRITWLDAMNSLFQYSMKINDKNTALKAVEAVLLEHPENITYYIYSGRLCFELKYYSDAVYYFNQAYQIAPSFSNATNLYLVYLKTDQPEQSLKCINTVINQNPERNLNKTKSLVLEIIELKNNLKTSPGNKELKQRIAMDYHMLNADEAAGNYSQAFKMSN
jgi:tetratricopeptide (TPR) repeat protein